VIIFGFVYLSLRADVYHFLFQFHHHLDDAKVLNEGPWLYDNFNMVIERIAPDLVSTSVNLNHMDIMVKVHQLPFGLIQLRVGNRVGKFLG